MAAVSALRRDLDRAGYYPELVADILDIALVDEVVVGHLVLPETTMDTELRRHMTVLALTATRLVMVHVDEVPASIAPDGTSNALASTEIVALDQIRSVGLTQVVPDPARYRSGRSRFSELTLAIEWGTATRVELEPAACDDPHCTADHGMAGSILSEDVALRVSAAAEGTDAVGAALRFARQLSQATARGAAARFTRGVS